MSPFQGLVWGTTIRGASPLAIICRPFRAFCSMNVIFLWVNKYIIPLLLNIVYFNGCSGGFLIFCRAQFIALKTLGLLKKFFSILYLQG